jgi:hypothetical protein
VFLAQIEKGLTFFRPEGINQLLSTYGHKEDTILKLDVKAIP